MKRFVVGVDGSAAAAAALQWAGALAGVTGAEIVAVNSFEKPWAEFTLADHERLVEERHRLLGGAWIRPTIDTGVSVRTVVRNGDPRDVVLSVARDEGADLVVLGRTGEGGGPGFLHLGSVVEHAAHHTSLPLAVIPSTASGPIERIVLGIDGSAHSTLAVDWCANLAKATNATVVAMTVWEPYLEWTPASSPYNWRRDLERQLAKWAAPISDAGTTVEYVIQRDLHPSDGLLGVASARSGDVLVVGARGAGGFSGLRAGGVAIKVLHRASLPVVMVPSRD
jgi:nucleotide-binding universal stress UspA family protein